MSLDENDSLKEQCETGPDETIPHQKTDILRGYCFSYHQKMFVYLPIPDALKIKSCVK